MRHLEFAGVGKVHAGQRRTTFTYCPLNRGIRHIQVGSRHGVFVITVIRGQAEYGEDGIALIRQHAQRIGGRTTLRGSLQQLFPPLLPETR